MTLEVKPKASRRLWPLAILLAAVFVSILFSLSRRPSVLDTWMSQMRTRGEKFTFQELGLDHCPEVTNQILATLKRVESQFAGLNLVSSNLTSAPAPPGSEIVLWRLNQLQSVGTWTMNWSAAESVFDSAEPVLAALRRELADPPAFPGGHYTNGTVRSDFVALRHAAQWLADGVVVELHRYDTERAFEDLLALVRLARLDRESYTLVCQMIRVAVAGLALESVWQALQCDGWTEPQLAQLQTELDRLSFTPEIVRTAEADRAYGLLLLEALRGADPQAAGRVAGNPSVFSPASRNPAAMVWRTFWSREDQFLYLQHMQAAIDGYRLIARGEVCGPVQARMAADMGALQQRLGSILGKRYWFCSIAIANHSRAVMRVVEVETLRHMAVTATALARYRLRAGQPPTQLEQLVPDLLSRMPADNFSGGPLRYTLRGGQPVIYSVGWDGRDDGGDPTVATNAPVLGRLPSWNSRDALWAQPAP